MEGDDAAHVGYPFCLEPHCDVDCTEDWRICRTVCHAQKGYETTNSMASWTIIVGGQQTTISFTIMDVLSWEEGDSDTVFTQEELLVDSSEDDETLVSSGGIDVRWGRRDIGLALIADLRKYHEHAVGYFKQ